MFVLQMKRKVFFIQSTKWDNSKYVLLIAFSLARTI